MKHTMKKLLCMALAIMLLVSAVPVFAMAEQVEPEAQAEIPQRTTVEQVGTQTVDYAVIFAVWNETSGTAVYSDAVAYARVAANAENEAIRSTVMDALAAKGYSSVSNNDIVREVQKKNSDIVHAVDFISTNTVIDSDNHQFRFVLNVKATPKDTRKDVDVDASIWLDRNNTKSFVKTTATVKVTLVECTTGDSAPTYTMKSNGGASTEAIRSALGAEFNNKTLAITMDGPSASKEVNYYVSVTGTSGSTGTNVPNYDGTTDPDNRIPVTGGSGNGGSSSGGSNSGSGSTTTYGFPDRADFYVAGKLVYSRWVTNLSQLEAAKAEAVNVIRNMGYKVNSWSVTQK